MDLAIDRATESGSAPERMLVNDGNLSDDHLARAIAERFGLDHVDLKLYRVDPDAAKLVAPAAVRRYQAVRSPSWATARCWSRWSIPPTSSPSTTSRS